MNDEKVRVLSDKVRDCGNNPKMLYRLVNNIMGNIIANPLPTATGDESLPNEFVEFLMDKIQKIPDALDHHSKYIPSPKVVPYFERFQPLSEKDVWSIVKSMPTKSCELDALPTQLLKDILDGILTPITHLVNTSLQKGIFPLKWKESIIRPLIKKAGLDPVKKISDQ